MTSPRDILARKIRANAADLNSHRKSERMRAMGLILAAVDVYTDSPDPDIDADMRADQEAAWRRAQRLNDASPGLRRARLMACADEAYGRDQDEEQAVDVA